MTDQRKQLDELLAEDPAAAAARAREAFERLAAPLQNTLVLFGAGNLGKKTLRGLRRLGIEAQAFADNNPRSWGQTVEGLPVLSPTEAARLHGARGVFVVTIWGAGQRHTQAEIQQQLRSLGCSRVVACGLLFWQHPEIFLPHYALDLPEKVLQEKAAATSAFQLLADAESRAEFLAQLRWRLFLDFEAVTRVSTYPQYFPDDLFRLRHDECFIDGGAFTGDTLKEYTERIGSFAKFIAFEPDPANFAALREHVGTLPEGIRARIDVRAHALGARRELVPFSATGTAASVVGQGDCVVETIALDEALAGESPTYIKLDIEGAEPEALAGARGLIGRHRPILAVCAYHRQDHLWRIPLLIREIAPDYQLYYRAHNREAFDLVCYALPRRGSTS